MAHILTINSGSSSVKFSLFEMGEKELLAYSGSLDRIGRPSSHFRVTGSDGNALLDEHMDLADHDAAFQALFDWLKKEAPDRELDAVGHRIVHGGSEYREPNLITPLLLSTLRLLVPLAPDHLPHEIKAVQSISRYYPELQQAACFDTAFHRNMPEVAQRYALPRALWHAGVKRYGFHGLSYEYILMELKAVIGEAANGRVIIAHLGNGASMAAVKNGIGIDTTMGYTPAGGLVMSTRAGDLDPGVVLYLFEERRMSPPAVSEMLNQYSGLQGVSGISGDMQDLLKLESESPQAAEAVALFCYQAKKFLGALTAALGGVDILVFTAGIGANASEIRRRICEGLEFLGIELDPEKNNTNASIISKSGSGVEVRVMQTNEELMIARHTKSLI